MLAVLRSSSFSFVCIWNNLIFAWKIKKLILQRTYWILGVTLEIGSRAPYMSVEIVWLAISCVAGGSPVWQCF